MTVPADQGDLRPRDRRASCSATCGALGLEESGEIATDGTIFRRHYDDEVLDEPRGALLAGRGRRIRGQAAH